MDTQEKVLPVIKPEITYDDFMKMDIRLCQILSVEKVENKDRLYKLKINTGIDERIVVSAIAEIFKPHELEFKFLPFVLNLPVRKIAGIESNGMIILAEDIINSQVLQVSVDNNLRPTGAILV